MVKSIVLKLTIIFTLIIMISTTYHTNVDLKKANDISNNLRNEIIDMSQENNFLKDCNSILLNYVNKTPDINIKTLSEVEVLKHSDVKAYMDYRSITSVNSYQYDMIYNSGLIDINDEGYLVDVDGFILVAMTSYFGDIGNRYLIELDTGEIVKVIKGDEKAKIHSSPNGFEHMNNGGVIEFIIDTDKMSQHKASNGYIYSGNFNNNKDYKGEIINIYYVDNIYRG